MKTLISIPDPLVEAADALALRLGNSRDELFTQAIEIYLSRHRLSDDDVTARLNAFFEAHPEAAEPDPAVQAAGLELLRRERW